MFRRLASLSNNAAPLFETSEQLQNETLVFLMAGCVGGT